MAFLLGFFLKNLQNLFLVGIVLKNSNLIVRTKSVYTFMIKIGCHEVPSIVLTHAKSVNRQLFPVFIAQFNRQLDSFAIAFLSFFKIKEIQTDFAHIHTCDKCQRKHTQPPGVVLDIAMHKCELYKVELVGFVQIDLEANAEEEFGQFPLTIFEDLVRKDLILKEGSSDSVRVVDYLNDLFVEMLLFVLSEVEG